MFSEQTKQQYLQRAKKIQKKYFRERAKTWQDDPNGFIDWVAAIGKNWVKSTWRLTFRTIEVSLEEDGAPFEVLEYLKKTAHDGYKERMSSLHQKRKIYGGPQRKKAISQADLDRFLSVLRADSDTVNGKIRSSQYDYLLLTFMEMNVYLGLRPNEAADIQLEKVSWGTAQDKAVTNVQLTGNTKVVANEADTDTVTADRF